MNPVKNIFIFPNLVEVKVLYFSNEGILKNVENRSQLFHKISQDEQLLKLRKCNVEGKGRNSFGKRGLKHWQGIQKSSC